MSDEIHHVRGRLRIRTAELKRNDVKARMVERALQSAPGIRSVEVNGLTGSLLVYYDAEALAFSDLLDIIHIRAKLCLAPARTQPAKPALHAKVANAVLWWAVEKAVERSLPLVIGALL